MLWAVEIRPSAGQVDREGRRIAAAAQEVRRLLDVPLGIHCHNDCDVAVANSLAAVKHGASQVQGTINGYGERCGNSNLNSIIANPATISNVRLWDHEPHATPAAGPDRRRLNEAYAQALAAWMQALP